MASPITVTRFDDTTTILILTLLLGEPSSTPAIQLARFLVIVISIAIYKQMSYNQSLLKVMSLVISKAK